MSNYIGNELDLFSNAINWKKYWASKLTPHICGNVLEVGAGIGTTTPFLFNSNISKWTCLEPDSAMSEQIQSKIDNGILSKNINVINGSLQDITTTYDTIIYIDVLEHIELDKEEVLKATSLLNKGGKIVSLSPAHQSLYNEFDKKIGHFRRYNKSSIKKLTNKDLSEIGVFYLDSVGLLASLTNKLFLKQAEPQLNQILFWDKYIIKTSKIIDEIFGFKLGKSIIAIWQRI